jgi:hypothetical protein
MGQGRVRYNSVVLSLPKAVEVAALIRMTVLVKVVAG